MSAGTYALAAVAAGVASEASGVTDATPIGRAQQAPDRPGADLATILERARAASERTGGGAQSVNLDLGGLAQPAQQATQAPAAGALAAALQAQQADASEWRERAEEWRERAEEKTEETRERTEEAADDATDVGTTVEDGVNRVVEAVEEATSGDGPTFDSGGDSGGGSSFLDKTERAGSQIESAGSGLKSGGRDVLDGVSRTGETVREATDLVVTGEADVAGTWDPRSGSDNTRIRRGTVTGAVKDRLPSGPDFSDDGPTLEDKARENVGEKLRGWF